VSWPLAKLDNHVDILSGFAFKSENFNDRGEGLPLVRIRDVVPGVSDTYYSGEYSSDFLLSDGDLLIGMDGDFNRAQWKGGQALLNQRVCKITAKSDSLDQGYLYHFLPKALDKIHAETPAVTVKHLSAKGIRAIEIPLPPLPEQKRIAAILDKADAIRRKRQQAIQLADDFLRAVFLDMFGDPATNPKGWETLTLRELIHLQGGFAFKSNDFSDAGIPVVKIGNANKVGFTTKDISFIRPENPEKLVQYELYPGDLLMSLTGTVGKDDYANVSEVTDDYESYYLNQRVAKISIRSERITKNYLRFFLAHPKIKSEITKTSRGVRQANISNGDIYELNIPLPEHDALVKFDYLVVRLNSAAQALSQCSRSDNALFHSLSQRAFAGQL
jgi:type I restriction enzyme S subunit